MRIGNPNWQFGLAICFGKNGLETCRLMHLEEHISRNFKGQAVLGRAGLGVCNNRSSNRFGDGFKLDDETISR